MCTVHNKHGSLLFLAYFLLSLEIIWEEKQQIERRTEGRNNVVKNTGIFRNCKFKMA